MHAYNINRKQQIQKGKRFKFKKGINRNKVDALNAISDISKTGFTEVTCMLYRLRSFLKRYNTVIAVNTTIYWC